MTKRLLALALIVPFAIPFVSSATSSFCPTLSRALAPGAKGDDVASLQRFLIFDGYLTSGNISGTYNAQTLSAVRQWQLAHKVITVDDDATTGAGLVGPKTRAAMLKSCGATDGSWATNGPPQSKPPLPLTSASPKPGAATTTFSSIGKCSPISRPTLGCAAWKGVMGKNGCVASWLCTKVASSTATSTAATNKPPYITSIAGPTSIATSTTASWRVNAADPEGGVLGYSFVWISLASPGQQQGVSQVFGNASTTSRSFDAPGIYALSATVRDSAGNTAGTSLQISVGTDTGGNSTTTPGGGTPLGNGAYCVYHNASFQDGTTIKLPDCTPLQSNSALCSVTGTDTMSCKNGHWFARGTTDVCTVAGQSTDSSNIFGCFNGGWTSPGDFPPGSYGGGVMGQPCFLEGQQSFTACPNMQNCFGGGSYLMCHNNVWQSMTVSAENDKLRNLANALTALTALLGTYLGNK